MNKITITSAYDDVGSEQGKLSNGVSTDDRMPSLSGTSQPNSWVWIYDNGEYIGMAPVNSSGKWEFSIADGVSVPLSIGEHSFTAGYVIGPNPNVPVFSDPFVLDIAPRPSPVIDTVYDHIGQSQGNLANGAITDDSHLTISGHLVAPGDTVWIYDNDKIVGYTNADSKGNWSYTFGYDYATNTHNALSEGEHVLQAGYIPSDMTTINDGPFEGPLLSQEFVVHVDAAGATQSTASELSMSDLFSGKEAELFAGSGDAAHTTQNGHAMSEGVVSNAVHTHTTAQDTVSHLLPLDQHHAVA